MAKLATAVQQQAPAKKDIFGPQGRRKDQTVDEIVHVDPIKLSGRKVTVACKLPNGFFLTISEPRKQVISSGGDKVETVTLWSPRPDVKIRILGNAAPFDRGERGKIASRGYALTHNVPEEYWEMWLAQNEQSHMVLNNLVFACTSGEYARDKAKEIQNDFTSGLEPLNPARRTTRDSRGDAVSTPVDKRWPVNKRGAAAIEEAETD